MLSVNEQNMKKLNDFFTKSKICFLSTATRDVSIGDELQVKSCPMTIQEYDPETNRLSFFMLKSGSLYGDVQKNNNIGITLFDEQNSFYVSANGMAYFTDEIEAKKKLFNIMTKAWFPEGPEDRELALMRVHLYAAEYWDAPNAKVVQLFQIAKALINSESVKDEIGVHVKVNL